MDPELLDVAVGASSTPDTTTAPDVTPSPSSSEPDVSAPSSGADAPADTKQELLAVVADVLKPKDPAPEPETKADTTVSGDAGDPDTDPDPADVPDDEMAKYSPNAQDRIRKLANTNRDLRKQLEAFQPLAEEQQKFHSFMQENHLQPDHVGVLLQFGATLRRGDLEGARAIMEPYWNLINEGLGEVLPADLRQQVDDGMIAEETAREVARTRSENLRLKNTLAETTQTQEATTAAQHAASIARATVDWEAEIKAKDPDYSAKADTVMEFAKAIIAERGRPRSPQEARQFAQEAYEKVNKTFARFRPAPAPTRPSPTGVQVSTPVAAEPKSLMEAAMLGLQKARTGT